MQMASVCGIVRNECVEQLKHLLYLFIGITYRAKAIAKLYKYIKGHLPCKIHKESLDIHRDYHSIRHLTHPLLELFGGRLS